MCLLSVGLTLLWRKNSPRHNYQNIGKNIETVVFISSYNTVRPAKNKHFHVRFYNDFLSLHGKYVS